VIAWVIPDGLAKSLNAEFGTAFVGRRPDEIGQVMNVDRAAQRRAILCHTGQSTLCHTGQSTANPAVARPRAPRRHRAFAQPAKGVDSSPSRRNADQRAS
jgi:hypothetical protein